MRAIYLCTLSYASLMLVLQRGLHDRAILRCGFVGLRFQQFRAMTTWRGPYFLCATCAVCAVSGASSMRLMARFSTGDERTMDVDVVPKGVSRSMRASRCSTERTCTFMMNESAPVPRWHSTTSGEFLTT